MSRFSFSLPVARRDVRTLLLAGALAATLAVPAIGRAWQGPPPIVRETVDAVMKLMDGSGDDSLSAFAEERLAESYRQELGGADAVLGHLRALRRAVRGSTDELAVELTDAGLVLQFNGARRVDVLLVLDESSGEIHRLELAEEQPSGDDAPSPELAAIRGHMRALEGLGGTGMSPRRFVEEHLSSRLRDARGVDELEALAERIGAATASAMRVASSGQNGVFRLQLRGQESADVVFEIEEAPPYRISSLRLQTEGLSDGVAGEADVPALDWARLEEQLEQAEEDGFAGTVLAVRDGKTVLHRSYGTADPGSGRPNTNDTVYDIGSLPFDFTRAAVYLLAQRGEIGLDDPLTRFFDDVPADKRSMTVRHLLEHRSGLPNFHHLPGDADPDLTWIGREEAVRRILAQPLQFRPGERTAVSHSAFGLLAAIVEVVAGRPYEVFLRDELLRPAGMERTGFYGDDLGLSPEAFAVGTGVQASDPNTPPEWGPTSWLIMGSGGMVSTPADLYRWYVFTRDGGVLEGRYRDAFLARPFVVGGSERGFMALTAWDRDDTMVFMASNTGGPGSVTDGLVRQLIRLAGARPPF